MFNNKTASEIKTIKFKQEEARNAPPLGMSLMVSSGRLQERVASELTAKKESIHSVVQMEDGDEMEEAADDENEA